MPVLSLVASDQVKLHVETAGSGEALVMIPGLGGVGSFWHPVRPALTDRFRTILIDQRGTGLSEPIACPTLQDLTTAYSMAAWPAFHHYDRAPARDHAATLN